MDRKDSSDADVEPERKKSIKRRGSIRFDLLQAEHLFRPEFIVDPNKTETNEKIWHLMETYLPRDSYQIQKSIITHIEYTLARTRFDLDKHVLYHGTALSVRDRLLESWNDSQMAIKNMNPKKINYLSIEFLLGRMLQNALVNMELEDVYKKALNELGYKLEDIYENENDPALGNGGLGRLAACFMDSLTTQNYPGWGYGIRYDFGIFRQAIENFQQKEFPDYWLTKGNPWEVQRLDVKYHVNFYGSCRDEYKGGKKVRVWDAGTEVAAIAYDTVIPGWNTFNCNTLRLWKSFPTKQFDFDSFNRGEFSGSVNDQNSASFITSVLYPNDSTKEGKELRLKQEYFFVCASISDLIRRFERYGLPWSKFPDYNAIQMNDTHPAIAIPELLRQLVDIYQLDYDEAFTIVRKTCSYTNHTVLPEALEKWSVELMGKLLPRHLELIYLINYHFLEKVKIKFPNDFGKHSRMSLVEEGTEKKIRMANLAIVGGNCVNGVAAIHSKIVKESLFKDFSDFFESHFTNVTNGVTPRRWIVCAFPELSDLLTKYSGNQDWIQELTMIYNLPEELEERGDLKKFLEKFGEAKIAAKKRLVAWVKDKCNIDIDPTHFFDIQVKRIHEYKRQLMNLFYCIHRYLSLKESKNKESFLKKVSFFGGKAAPGYYTAKSTIRLINMVANVVNNDSETNKYFKIVFLPDYKVSAAQIIIPAADLSEHISTAGTEASGTSNMKFAMTGSLIVGTRDGANIEIAEEIKEDNIFFFGATVDQVEGLKNDVKNGKLKISPKLSKVFEALYGGRFGDIGFFKEYLTNLTNGGDHYLYCHDFVEYERTHEKIDACYKNREEWEKKCVLSICRMGFFSSDRSIEDYAQKIWKLSKIEVPRPTLTKEGRVISSSNLKDLENESKKK